jgi:hypothetical protein
MGLTFSFSYDNPDILYHLIFSNLRMFSGKPDCCKNFKIVNQ